MDEGGKELGFLHAKGEERKKRKHFNWNKLKYNSQHIPQMD